jgi:thiol-disulfide isomerase/thioredoxin
MIHGVKYILLIGCIFLVACNPLSEKDVLADKNAAASTGLAQQGTALVAGDFAPQDHWSGQWRVINIWAEWCKPCWQEIPELNQFFAEQENAGVKLLGFNFDELAQDELAELKEKMSIQFPLLTEWPNAWTKPDIRGLPATIILSPDDQVINILWGPQSLESLYKGIEDSKKVIKDRLEEY